jgi:hypothetical protein
MSAKLPRLALSATWASGGICVLVASPDAVAISSAIVMLAIASDADSP